jgi:hypothetical protein
MNLYKLEMTDIQDNFLKIPYEYNTIFHCGAGAGPIEKFDSIEDANEYSLTLKNKNFDFVWVDTENFYDDSCEDNFMHNGRIERMKDYAQKSNEKIFVYDYELKQDKDSISNLLNDNGFSNNLALLVLDIDSIDYYVLKNFMGDSEVIICEFNPVYGKYLTSYRDQSPNTVIIGEYGASMHAMCFALKDRNYKILGFRGTNIIFVKQKFEYRLTEELLSFETEDELDLIWENWEHFNSDDNLFKHKGKYDKVLRSVIDKEIVGNKV